MKHLLVLLALVVGFASLPVPSFAKDKKDDWKDSSKRLRDDLNLLDAHYSQVKDRVKYMGGSDRRLWDGLRDIRSSIDRINYDVSSDRFDGRDISKRIQRAHDDLRRLQDQMEYNNKRRGSYRPN